MSNHQGGDTEYMADECEMEDVEDGMDDESINRERGGVESDTDEYDNSSGKVVTGLQLLRLEEDKTSREFLGIALASLEKDIGKLGLSNTEIMNISLVQGTRQGRIVRFYINEEARSIGICCK
ncbi:uncharacterized protein LOC109794179 [Cajanus cajan]|uniref:uncharacterized protein LOC109794179 n=1 Tax=Cajanus cajan TaxID=3821 RepID=UPI0010FB208B|nr:uncharacterized protein LOC109794179 [Cajanus cajan]